MSWLVSTAAGGLVALALVAVLAGIFAKEAKGCRDRVVILVQEADFWVEGLFWELNTYQLRPGGEKRFKVHLVAAVGPASKTAEIVARLPGLGEVLGYGSFSATTADWEKMDAIQGGSYYRAIGCRIEEAVAVLDLRGVPAGTQWGVLAPEVRVWFKTQAKYYQTAGSRGV